MLSFKTFIQYQKKKERKEKPPAVIKKAHLCKCIIIKLSYNRDVY